MEYLSIMQEVTSGISKEKKLELLIIAVQRWGSTELDPRHLQSTFWLAVSVFLKGYNNVGSDNVAKQQTEVILLLRQEQTAAPRLKKYC